MTTLPKQITHWSIEDVCHWMKENRFEDQVESFRENSIDGKALTLLDKTDINELIRKIGPRVKFRAKLSQLLSSKTIYQDKHEGAADSTSSLNYTKHQQQQLRHQSKGHLQQQRYNFIQVYQPNTQQPFVQQIPQQQYIRNANPSTYGPSTGFYPIANTQQQQQQQQHNGIYDMQQNIRQQKNKKYQKFNANASNQKQSYYSNSNNKRVSQNVQNSGPVLKHFVNEMGERKNYWSYNEPEVDDNNNSNVIGVESQVKQEDDCDDQQNTVMEGDSQDTTEEELARITPEIEAGNYNEEENDTLVTPRLKTTDRFSDEDPDEVNATEGEEKTSDFLDPTEGDKNNDLNISEENKNNDFNGTEENKTNAINTTENHANKTENERYHKTERNDDHIENNMHLLESSKDGDLTVCNTSDKNDQDEGESMNMEREDLENLQESESHSMISEDQLYGNDNFRFNPYEVEVIDVSQYDSQHRPKLESKLTSIEKVTNRLALRERSKIFRRSEKKWHIAVNETAYQLALKNPHHLQNKKQLRLIAEAEVRKTYRFAKGKSRSIAIPENRIASEERKKQKLTKEKISDMKRKLNAEAEDVSRKMRQCHMNLTLSGQQSDKTKTMQLKEEMQRLTQKQAKIHFSMDELLAKERKLNTTITITKKDNDGNQTNYKFHDSSYNQQNFYSENNIAYISTPPSNFVQQQLSMATSMMTPMTQVPVAQLRIDDAQPSHVQQHHENNVQYLTYEPSTM